MSAGARLRGFTLVELLVAFAVLGLLVVSALPSYSEFLRNAQIRTVAQSIESGLQLARAEAVRANAQVQFRLTGTLAGGAVSGGSDWSVMRALNATPAVFDQPVSTRTESNASSVARVGVSTASGGAAAAAGAGLPASIVFTGLGRLSAATTVRQIDITGPAGSRRLAVQLTAGGDIRMCDPALARATDPQGCS
ncbi:MAG: GspH/FimT family pseudopilin [Burkholderiaceae bacterium]|nr:GspH/FimT family pseudopilin [Burkholderiaceae bacterium]